MAPTLDKSKVVVNLSRQREKEVLALGLDFAIAPTKIPVNEIIAATEAT